MNVVSTGMLLLLITGSVHAQEKLSPVNTVAPDVKATKMVIVKILPASVVDKALAQAGKSPLFLEVYPVKVSADHKKQDFDALVVFRDARHVQYPARTVNEKQFASSAMNYATYMRAQKVPRSQVPFGYSIPVNWRTAGAKNYKIGIDLQRASISVIAGGAYAYKCDSCKCPPQCSSFGQAAGTRAQRLLYSDRMEKVVRAAYLQQQ